MPLTKPSDGQDQKGAHDRVDKKGNPQALRHEIPRGSKETLAGYEAFKARLQASGPTDANEEERAFNSDFRRYISLCGHEHVCLFLRYVKMADSTPSLTICPPGVLIQQRMFSVIHRTEPEYLDEAVPNITQIRETLRLTVKYLTTIYHDYKQHYNGKTIERIETMIDKPVKEGKLWKGKRKSDVVADAGEPKNKKRKRNMSTTTSLLSATSIEPPKRRAQKG